jgi:hypothetical protein
MTLKEALEVTYRESREQGLTGRADGRAVHHQVLDDHRQIRASGVLSQFMPKENCTTPVREIDLEAVLRFGMRVQRKLDHPERVTTVYHSENQP